MSNTVIVLMGRSGSGKSRLEGKLAEYRPELFHKVISVTTRQPRETEESGSQYFFLSNDAFDKLEQAGKLIQKTWFHDNFYGSAESEYMTECPYAVLTATPSSLKTAVPEWEKRGINVMYVYFDLSEDLLRRNMARRGDPADKIDERLAADDLHMQFMRSGITPDYVVKDQDLDDGLHVRFLRWLIPSEGQVQVLSTG